MVYLSENYNYNNVPRYYSLETIGEIDMDINNTETESPTAEQIANMIVAMRAAWSYVYRRPCGVQEVRVLGLLIDALAAIGEDVMKT